MLTGELQGATDHAAVMTPDREVPRSTEQGLEVLEVGAVDLRACTVRDVRGLFVRSLDKTDPGRFLNQPIDVVGRPVRGAARRSRACRPSYGRSPCPTREPGHPPSRHRGPGSSGTARTLCRSTRQIAWA